MTIERLLPSNPELLAPMTCTLPPCRLDQDTCLIHVFQVLPVRGEGCCEGVRARKEQGQEQGPGDGARMGRKKIQISRITDERNRQVE